MSDKTHIEWTRGDVPLDGATPTCYADNMARWNIGAKNGTWKGGRSIASNGYVLVRVGRGHGLADVRGYAYEHRVVAEAKIGRRLRAGEIVHHLDGDRQNNRPTNLEVLPTSAHHFVEHRSAKNRDRLRKPGETNPPILCACGCLTRLAKYDASNRPRRFISGHNRPESPTQDAVRRLLAGGPMHRIDLAECAGTTVQAVATMLSKLARMGLVVRVGVGRWRLASG